MAYEFEKMTTEDSSSFLFHFYKKFDHYMLGVGKTLRKGERWELEEGVKPKFFDLKKQVHDKVVQYGLYVGRFAFVFIKPSRK